MDNIDKSKVNMLPDGWVDLNPELLQEEVLEVSKPVGLYAQIPFVCSMDRCRTKDTCRAYKSGMAKSGMTCIKEAAMIINTTARYCEDLKINPEKDFIDLMIVRDLVACDVEINRCHEYLRHQDVVIDEVFTVTKEGREIEQSTINKAILVLDIMLNKKEKILKSLNATRKDKAQVNKDKVFDLSQLMVMARKGIPETVIEEEA